MKHSTMLQNKWVRLLLAVAFWAAVWQFLASYVGISLLLPTPMESLRVLLVSLTQPDFWLTVASSLLRVFGGFAVGCVLAVLSAVLTTQNTVCDILLTPMIRLIRAVPVFSFISLAMLCLHSAVLPAVIAVLIVLPVVWANVAEGIAAVNPQLLEMTCSFGFGFRKRLRFLYLPSVLPYFRSGAVTALGLACKSAVTAEVLCKPVRAIGTQLHYSRIYMETAELFAWSVTVILLSLFMERGLAALLKRLPGGGWDDDPV